jgi:glutamine amidotransferase
MNSKNRIVGIIDYGTGNIASIYKAVKILGNTPILVSDVETLAKTNCIILPGVGHYSEAIKSLKKNLMFDALKDASKSGILVLGICLGFQILTKFSEESFDEGLGILPFDTVRISPKNSYLYRVPHMGWNSIKEESQKTTLLKNINADKQLFFFSNAYGVKVNNNKSIKKAFYKHEMDWIAIAENENVFGVQFHPEKSRDQGLKLLNNFFSKTFK